jgi:acetyltransferase-like isoleucine patch superfamily enzyme
MKLGIRKKLKTLLILLNLVRFKLRLFLYGFDHANQLTKVVDKDSLVELIRKYRAHIGEDCDIETGLTFHNCKNYSNLKISNNCHIGKNCFFDLRGKVKIQDNVVVSMQVTFLTHLDMNKSGLKSFYPPTQGDILICQNTYIGANATILQGVTVHQNSIIAAGAVVTKDVEPYTMVGGVPAKVIKKLDVKEQSEK